MHSATWECQMSGLQQPALRENRLVSVSAFWTILILVLNKTLHFGEPLGPWDTNCSKKSVELNLEVLFSWLDTAISRSLNFFILKENNNHVHLYRVLEGSEMLEVKWAM